MARFKVYFTPEADEEVLASYEWGVLFWGRSSADTWLREFYRTVIDRLSEFPLSCSIAPENGFLEQEIRHYHYDRYRVVFEVLDDEVTVFRVVGPFTSLPGYEDLPLE